jgi:hypothetical protein
VPVTPAATARAAIGRDAPLDDADRSNVARQGVVSIRVRCDTCLIY